MRKKSLEGGFKRAGFLLQFIIKFVFVRMSKK